MIKARAGDHIIFGLSDENLKRLREGHPIKIDMRELGFTSGTVFIFHGETEQSMREELADMIGPETEYRDDFGKPQ